MMWPLLGYLGLKEDILDTVTEIRSGDVRGAFGTLRSVEYRASVREDVVAIHETHLVYRYLNSAESMAPVHDAPGREAEEHLSSEFIAKSERIYRAYGINPVYESGWQEAASDISEFIHDTIRFATDSSYRKEVEKKVEEYLEIIGSVGLFLIVYGFLFGRHSNGGADPKSYREEKEEKGQEKESDRKEAWQDTRFDTVNYERARAEERHEREENECRDRRCDHPWHMH